jgi:flagellar M-ring protein FliF
MNFLSKKVGLNIGIGLIFLAAIAIVFLLFTNEKTILFSGLTQDTLVEYTAKLEQSGIAYDVNLSDLTILVAKSDVNQARVIVMEESVQSNHITGLELYENTDISSTERAQQANYTRALQGEIERTLTAFSYVKKARVHLSIPKKKLFLAAKSAAKASVTVFLVDHYQPRPADIQSIKHLVASAVDELSVENIIVIDGKGVHGSFTSTDGGDNKALAIRKNAEAYLENKVYQVLLSLFDSGAIAVSVALDITTENIKTLETKAIKGAKGNGLIVSELYQEEIKDAKKAEAETKSSRREVQYQHGSRVEETEQEAGIIKKISVAVSINAQLAATEQKNVEALVYHTLGLDKTRGDQITVQFFDIVKATESAKFTPEPTTKPAYVAQVKNSQYSGQWPLILTIIMMTLLVLLCWFYLHRSQSDREQALANDLNRLFDVNELKTKELV